MNNFRMILANMEQVVQKGKGRTNKKKSKEAK